MDLLKRLRQSSAMFLWLMLILFIVLLLIAFFWIGFALWFWLFLVIWLLFFFLYFHFLIKLSFISRITVLILIIVISIFFLFVGHHTTSNNSTSNTSASSKKLTTAECSPDVSKYDGRVLAVSGDNIIGRISLTANADKCRIEAKYLLVVTANLAENPYGNLPYLYKYIGLMHQPNQTDRNSSYGTGVIAVAYNNKTTFPAVGITDPSTFYAPNGLNNGTTPTDTFYAYFERWYELSDTGYQQLQGITTYELVDSLPYTITETLPGGGISYTTDMTKAEVEGTIVKTFNFKVAE